MILQYKEAGQGSVASKGYTAVVRTKRSRCNNGNNDNVLHELRGSDVIMILIIHYSGTN